MSKHELWELQQMQAMPLDVKVALTRERIRNWYKGWDGQIYLSFSGGKDSTVLKHIVDDMYDDIPSVFVNTGLEYPEVQRFAMAQKNVITIRPKMGFREVITKYGYPIISKEISQKISEARSAINNGNTGARAVKHFNGEIQGRYDYSRYKHLISAPFMIAADCCYKLKKKPAQQYEKETGRKMMLAMMTEESYLRQQNWVLNGCNAFEMKRPRSTPMAFWTEQDVLHYIIQNDLKIASVYGEIKLKQTNQLQGQINLIDQIGYEDGDKLQCTGCQRTGCVFCGFGCHVQKGKNNFQRLKETHPKQWAYCIGGGEYKDGLWQPNEKGLGMAKVLDFIGVKYE